MHVVECAGGGDRYLRMLTSRMDRERFEQILVCSDDFRREDYEDYLNVRGLKIWDAAHPSFNRMLEYCRTHNQPADYEPFLPRLTDEKIANMSLTLCHMVDKMMLTYQSNLEKRFVEEGGIRERMTAARLGYRNQQKQTIISLKQTITQLQQENQQLMARIAFLERQLNNNQPS